jgi:phosphohistidine phosphatase SixA
MPDVAEMTAVLIGDRRTALDFSKGAVAAIDFDGPPAAGAGVLRWFITAKLLGC